LEKIMRSKQSGFTLIEIAIVLVIIGLLLGGVLKGQELINSAKVKNFAQDFRNIPLFIYGYQDKYRALPGDHATAATAVTGAANCAVTANTCVPGNGVINGTWDAALANALTTETLMFWQHVRLAGLAAGPTTVADVTYRPTNADGGLMGIEAGAAAVGGAFIGANAAPVIAALTPTYLMCSDGVLGKFAKQLDTTLDDGNTATGSMRSVNGLNATVPHVRGQPALATAAINDADSYTVCMGL
jgi:prepilin-type N-terminal cleavage/methylation domain-containing protein